MRVSIITVAFNSAKTIAGTIRSVAAQTHGEIEHIIVDGQSSDETLDVVRNSGGRIDKLISEKDNGIYDAMNKGLRLATGDVVGFLNSDDSYASPDVIESVVRALEDSQADCLFADLVYVRPDDPEKVLRAWKSSSYSPGKFKTGWHPAHPTFFVRKKVLEALGGFDEAYRISADYELMLRLLERHRISSTYLPKILVRMSDGGESNRNLKNVLVANIECYRAFAKNGVRVSPFVMIRKPMSKVHQYFSALRLGGT
jgi:glycosyltransferase involved in cell wall biosynthesis